MAEYRAVMSREGQAQVLTGTGAIHSLHDDMIKANRAADALNNGGEKEYQQRNWDNED